MAQALREVGETVEIHDDHFAPDAKDEDWLTEVGSRAWIVLTKDDRIRYRVTERTALASARVRGFCADLKPTASDRNGYCLCKSTSTDEAAYREPHSSIHWPGFKKWERLAVVR